MPRKKKEGVRHGSHTYQQFSATTFQTIASGVTLCEKGIEYSGNTAITPTELGYLDGIGGPVLGNPSAAGNLFSGGTVVWSGSTESVNSTTHGLTTLLAFTTQFVDHSTSRAARCRVINHPSGVSMDVVAQTVLGGTTTIPASAGGTIQWMAFGS